MSKLADPWHRLACGWVAFHVDLCFGELGRLAIHSLFFVVIVWCLFLSDARRFFQKTRTA